MPASEQQVRRRASLSLDLDNEWSYLKTHGDAGWVTFPSYLDVVVPRVLSILAGEGLRITFFVVGQDAALPANHDAVASIVAAGHEVGNHSFSHEPWLHRYKASEVRDELVRTADAVEAVTGRRPVGFRGPGYSLSPSVLQTLVGLGYRYDASTLPTVIGPLARAFYFRRSELTDEQREERALLFGSASEALRPLRPYRWEVGGASLLEIPVTTMPLLRVPIHVSYLLWLGERSPKLATAYFRVALAMCRAARVEPSILLHPLDFLGGDDVASLSFFPGMQLSGAQKTERVAALLGVLREHFEVVSMEEHAEAIEQGPGLPVVAPGRRRPSRRVRSLTTVGVRR